MTDRNPRLKSIEEEWQDFACAAFSGFDPAPKYEDINSKLEAMNRDSFFAGAFSVISACALMGTPEVSEGESVAYFEARERELAEYFRQLKQRKAAGGT